MLHRISEKKAKLLISGPNLGHSGHFGPAKKIQKFLAGITFMQKIRKTKNF